MLVSVTSDEHRIKARFDTAMKSMRRAGSAATEKSIEAIREHLRNNLLAGGMLNDTTGMPRSETNSSLKPGALRKAVRVRATKRADGVDFKLYLQGDDQIHFVAKKLMEGVHHTWTISPVRKKMLSFYLHQGMFKGTKIMQKSVTHTGLKPRPFLQQAVTDKIAYARGAFRRELQKGIQSA